MRTVAGVCCYVLLHFQGVRQLECAFFKHVACYCRSLVAQFLTLRINGYDSAVFVFRLRVGGSDRRQTLGLALASHAKCRASFSDPAHWVQWALFCRTVMPQLPKCSGNRVWPPLLVIPVGAFPVLHPRWCRTAFFHPPARFVLAGSAVVHPRSAHSACTHSCDVALHGSFEVREWG